MPRVKRSGSFDDGWGRLIRGRTPGLAVDSRTVALPEAVFDAASKVTCPTAIRRPYAVRICRLPSVIRFLGSCREEDWEDRCVVTRLVEVLQIQRVVPGLVVVSKAKLVFTALKLDWEDGRPGNQHSIDS